ncbi:MAG: SPOR domain-containing protein [Paracoccaceae bacterium]
MKLSYFSIGAVLAALAMPSGAAAQAQGSKAAPAEFPPLSYRGTQYVDSQGCVYVRAGTQANVTWVPRLTRSRKHVCGAKPTQVAGRDGGTAREMAGVEVLTLDAPVASAPVAQTATVKRKVKPKVVAKPAQAATAAAPTVRVSPKKTQSVTGPVASTDLPGATRVVPKHLAKQRANSTGFKVPRSYRPAWDDDRLNSKRAEGTLAGRDQMNLIWTTTVPRRLIDQNTGRDMTARVALVYPYTDFATQRRKLGEVTLMTRNGQTVKRIVRNRAAAQAPAQDVPAGAKAKPVAAKVAPARNGQSASVGRFVQVGTFGVPSNAQNTATRLRQLGMPVQIGTLTRGGRTLQTVMAGPFTQADAARKALVSVRRQGFGDAYLRN